MKVTFFGHKNTPREIESTLRDVLINLIQNENADKFYVGNHGSFDLCVQNVLKKLKEEYKIDYYIVLAYMPQEKASNYINYEDTIYPDGLESVPLKLAICKRNEWMISQSDIVITYVKRDYGGASKYKKMSEKKGKRVINLYQ
ncbi:MAG: hypothetical protein IJ408_00280 [Clostridia bacterium]|nr:hypothetical protein [Clostridia bacterium]